jgi:hypothetical protein
MARNRAKFPPIIASGTRSRELELRSWPGWPPRPTRPTLILDKLTGECRWVMPATGKWKWDPEAREWFELDAGIGA